MKGFYKFIVYVFINSLYISFISYSFKRSFVTLFNHCVDLNRDVKCVIFILIFVKGLNNYINIYLLH